MNNPSTISLSPSLLARNNKKVYVVAGKTNKEIHNVIVNGNGMVKWNCSSYKVTKICSHSVATSEKQDILQNHVAKIKGCRSRAAPYPLNAKSSGRKRGQKRHERSYKDKPSQEWNAATANQSPFTKIWHNNHPLKICSVLIVPSKKSSCGHCGHEFPRGPLAIVPLDIVIVIKNAGNISPDIGQQKTI